MKNIFKVDTPRKMALGSSLGVLIGFLPIMGIKIICIGALSLIFQLNIITVFVGTCLITIMPILNALPFWVAGKLAGYEIPIFSFRYLNFQHLRHWSLSIQYHFIGSIIVGIGFSVLLYPVFKWFYNRNYDKGYEQHINDKCIFYDVKGNRKLFVKKTLLVFLCAVFIVLIIFFKSITDDATIPSLGLNNISKFSKIIPINVKLGSKNLAGKLRKYEKKNPTYQVGYKKHNNIKFIKSNNEKNQKKEVYAFYVNWDENSKFAFERNAENINYVIPEWYHLSKNATLNREDTSNIIRIASENNVKIMPLINNNVNDKWDSILLHNMLCTKENRNKLVNSLYRNIKNSKYCGVNIDFEELNEKDKKTFIEFMKELYTKFNKNRLMVTIDVPAQDDSYDYVTLSKYVDRMIVMLYDEHDQTSTEGPIASTDWYNNILENANIPEGKLITALGNYGYDWTDDTSTADAVTFGDITDMTTQGKIKIQWDAESGNPYFRYKDGDENHTVWFLDGATLYNEVKTSMKFNSKGVAVWRLGSEDPSIWHVLKNLKEYNTSLNSLKDITCSDPVRYLGKGEVLKIKSAQKSGSRKCTVDKDGYINSENYISFPKPYEIERYGYTKDKKVVLSFDDGPDPKYTPQILNILNKYKIKGTFFVIGENGEMNPDLIERLYSEGHEIGNHTFTHPNVAQISDKRTEMELNANQRLVQELTGHSMTMFRPPYVADAEPSTENEILPVIRAQHMGYTMIGELIDPNDWQKPSTNVIIDRVMSGVKAGNGNVILLHDGGGNRENTVKALPIIIEKLKSQGYKFVTINELLGKSKEDVMPSIKGSERTFMLYDKAVYDGVFGWNTFISILFYAAIFLGIIKYIVLMILSYKQKKSYEKLTYSNKYSPFVSVVIAAYNEEKVICKTINSILKSSYKDYEIIIVDDGSKDNTSNVVEENFKDYNNIRIIRKKNGGKASAINKGILEAKGNLIVSLDADTIIDKKAISLMIRHFEKENVAAVSGNAKVGNVNNVLTKWQHIEYVTGFNLERRAFHSLNCITVVPGAIGAWRKDVIVKCGLFKEDTLAEDTDLTITVLEHEYRIEYEEKAYAYTEAPEKIKDFIKQRYRWCYGTLQCLWKHKRALFNRKLSTLGYIALPNMWIFQFIFQTFSPIADILFIIGMFGNEPKKILAYYLTFFAVDLLASIFAFKLEGENLKPLLWLFLQRIVYRQFMVFVIIKSIISALIGISVGWNKLDRAGSVNNIGI